MNPAPPVTRTCATMMSTPSLVQLGGNMCPVTRTRSHAKTSAFPAPNWRGNCGTQYQERDRRDMAYEFATYEKQGRIAIVTLNRPERMNALHPPAHFALHELLNDFEHD